jgi:hypothetical protein
LRKTLIAVLAVTLLSGCSAASKGAATKTVSEGASSSAVSTTPSPVADEAVLAELQAGAHPPCSAVVNEPVNLVVTGTDSSGQLSLRCITGASASTDNTKSGSILCDPGDPTSLVYYWFSQAAANADQHVYAAKAGGIVLVVPNETATQFTTAGPALAAVVAAVGMRC